MAFFLQTSAKLTLPTPEQALPGRAEPMPVPSRHEVLGTPLQGPLAEGQEEAIFGLGCFWGAERAFWKQAGVVSTSVGYAGGITPHPTYEEVCSGRTGHAEVVRVVFEPAKISYDALLRLFWESHDPTMGMRQGNDVGTQYRSALYTFGPHQAEAAERSRAAYAEALRASGHPAPITTELREAPTYYFAEPAHQQYLHKNPHGYCGLGGTGVSCPIGLGVDG